MTFSHWGMRLFLVFVRGKVMLLSNVEQLCMAETLGLRYLVTDVFCLICVFFQCIFEFVEI